MFAVVTGLRCRQGGVCLGGEMSGRIEERRLIK